MWPPLQYRRNVYGLPIGSLQGGDNLKLLQYRLNFRRVLRLQCANHYVLPSLAASTAFVEHLEGFANPRGVAEENFQSPAARPPFFLFDLREQLLGAGPLK